MTVYALHALWKTCCARTEDGGRRAGDVGVGSALRWMYGAARASARERPLKAVKRESHVRSARLIGVNITGCGIQTYSLINSGFDRDISLAMQTKPDALWSSVWTNGGRSGWRTSGAQL